MYLSTTFVLVCAVQCAQVAGKPLVDIMVAVGLQPSKGAARK